MTYRLMAEKASDLICQKMGISPSCLTHHIPLPGAREYPGVKERLKKTVEEGSAERGETLCECELVHRDVVERFLMEGRLRDLQDILHRTRLAKGTCQGGFCVYRLLGLLHELKPGGRDSNKILRSFLEERWKGIRPILWGVSLKENELIESIYKGIFNL